ncbi:hypothetical protein P154DRAFT_527384, partial [Amniculicola lignicola CBS 123094]
MLIFLFFIIFLMGIVPIFLTLEIMNNLLAAMKEYHDPVQAGRMGPPKPLGIVETSTVGV